MEIACTCEAGCGVAHSHVPEQVVCCWKNDESHQFTLNARDFNLNQDQLKEVSRVPPTLRIWVNWKEVARRLAQTS